jgi:hypothetical protein
MTSTAIRIKQKEREGQNQATLFWKSGEGFDRDHLPTVIKTASRADPMRHKWRRALRAFGQLGEFEHAVVGTAHPLAASRGFTFRYAHKKSLI